MSNLYFAYGSNLNIEDLKRYEKRKNIEQSESFVNSTKILNGIFFLPGKLGAISISHTKEDIKNIIQASENF